MAVQKADWKAVELVGDWAELMVALKVVWLAAS
jgi:hypothetical protein